MPNVAAAAIHCRCRRRRFLLVVVTAWTIGRPGDNSSAPKTASATRPVR